METTGSSARVLMLDEMDPNQPIIIAPAVTFWDARYGRGRFKQAYPKLRWMAALNVEHIFLITMDKNIKTKEDLIGKRVFSLGPAKSTHGKEIIDAWGLTDEIKIVFGGWKDSVSMLQDGLVDAAQSAAHPGVGGVNLPVEGQLELYTTRADDIYFINVDPDTVNTISEQTKVLYLAETLPPLTMGPNQTETLQTFFSMTGALVVSADMDEDIVYKMTKALAEGSARFGQHSATLAWINPTGMVRFLVNESEADIHPGALRYYKEAGLSQWIK